MKRSPLILCALVLGMVNAGRAESRPSLPNYVARNSPVFTLYFENDYFAGTDRHYTSGVKLSWLSADLIAWGQTGWRKRLVEALPFVNRPGAEKNFGLALGQNIYTPQDTQRMPSDPADRPYAGWTYLECSFVSKTESVMDTLSFQLGMVGRHSYAQDIQSVIHEWLNNSQPAGWKYQIKDEAGINVVFERQWRLYAHLPRHRLGFDLVPHAGVSLGNVQTYANAGLSLRLGVNLPSDFGVSLIRGGSFPNAPIDDLDPRLAARRAWSVFLLGGVDGRAVLRDIFLDGNTFRDSASVDKKPFVGDAYAGIGVVWRKWQFTYTMVARSREFEAQTSNSYFGSITLSRAF